MSKKSEIKALILRIRLYEAQKKPYLSNNTQRMLYACEIMQITLGTARNILNSDKRIKNLSLKEALSELKQKDEYMYRLAITDIEKDLY
ncbi:MAG: hypothetical protein IJ748_02145 [Bacteroidales bacterium]|nr:hypothetical protein [Bacteroidales bacterium]